MTKVLRFFGLWWVVGLSLSGCEPPDPGVPLAGKQSSGGPPENSRLLCRIAHITDTQAVDEESPSRLSGADHLVDVAWRPQEAYSTQLIDGMVRAIDRYHREVAEIDVVIHTGDAIDNAQYNELRWFMDAMDGGVIDPLSGIDDREAADIPPAHLDPHAPFEARGLAGTGIPWLSVYGNHDAYALGIFPTVEVGDGNRIAPMPFEIWPGVLLPAALNPLADVSHDFVSPAHPGPPPLLGFPVSIRANPDRRFVTKAEFIMEHFNTTAEPAGHGFDSELTEQAYYSYLLRPDLRLVVLDTTDVPDPKPGGIYFEASLSQPQLDWFVDQLDQAAALGERVIVASHHPSASLRPTYGSVVGPTEFRALMQDHPQIILHLVGHTHRHRVIDRGTYLEIETASILDFPQEGRIVEVYAHEQTGEITIRYSVFTHLNEMDDDPDDPMAALRREAFDLATDDVGVLMSVFGPRERGSERVLPREYFRGAAGDREGEVSLGAIGM